MKCPQICPPGYTLVNGQCTNPPNIPLPPVNKCPDGQTFNPSTGICEPTKIIPTCPPGYTYNPDLGKCTKNENEEEVKDPKVVIDCPSGYTYNPETQLCEKVDPPTNNVDPEVNYECPAGYTYNSYTGKCHKNTPPPPGNENVDPTCPPPKVWNPVTETCDDPPVPPTNKPPENNDPGTSECPDGYTAYYIDGNIVCYKSPEFGPPIEYPAFFPKKPTCTGNRGTIVVTILATLKCNSQIYTGSILTNVICLFPTNYYTFPNRDKATIDLASFTYVGNLPNPNGRIDLYDNFGNKTTITATTNQHIVVVNPTVTNSACNPGSTFNRIKMDARYEQRCINGSVQLRNNSSDTQLPQGNLFGQGIVLGYTAIKAEFMNHLSPTGGPIACNSSTYIDPCSCKPSSWGYWQIEYRLKMCPPLMQLLLCTSFTGTQVIKGFDTDSWSASDNLSSNSIFQLFPNPGFVEALDGMKVPLKLPYNWTYSLFKSAKLTIISQVFVPGAPCAEAPPEGWAPSGVL